MTLLVVAIDGPAGAGKSTTSRAVARALGLEVLDTGAMYRAVTYAVLEAGASPTDAEASARVAREAAIEVADRVTVDGVDVTGAIRGPEVTEAVSAVSAHPEVRRFLVERQRRWVEARGGGVVEGRDIGTVVFPDAPVKVFLTADPGIRAHRRQADEAAAARSAVLDDVQSDLERRDALDSTRTVAPLQPAHDAVTIDTSAMSVEDVVEVILGRVREAS